MPVSSRKIINAINAKPFDFTRNELIAELIRPGSDKRGGKGKRKAKRGPEKEASLIQETLNGLAAAGLIRRKKNRYLKIHSFVHEGKIRITSRGEGVLPFGDAEIAIKRDNTGGSHDNDLVSVRIVDFRKGSIYGEVREIIRRGRDLYIARAVHRTREMVLFNLVDSPGNREA